MKALLMDGQILEVYPFDQYRMLYVKEDGHMEMINVNKIMCLHREGDEAEKETGTIFDIYPDMFNELLTRFAFTPDTWDMANLAGRTIFYCRDYTDIIVNVNTKGIVYSFDILSGNSYTWYNVFFSNKYDAFFVKDWMGTFRKLPSHHFKKQREIIKNLYRRLSS